MVRKRALLLVNARSRLGGADLALAHAALRRCGIDVVEERLEDCARIGDVLERRAAEVELVIVGGGDGTLNAAADAVAVCGLPMGVLPLGTANDLARTLGLPLELEAACSVIAEGRVRAIDLGLVNGKRYFNVASLGLGVQVARRLTGEAKRRWGVLGYPLAARDAWRAARSFTVEILCDGRRERLRSLHLAVANGRHYGGGMTAAPDAAIDDGLLDLWSLRPMSPWRMMRLLPALRRGDHASAPEVDAMRGRTFVVETERPMPINTDGELTSHTPARFEVAPAALKDLRAGAGRGGRGVSVLREEREIALTDAVVALKDAARQLEDEADVLGRGPVPSLFRELSGEHRAMAAELDSELRRLGYKTREPDPDAETGKELLTRVKAALADDEARTLLQEREAAEETVAAALDAALAVADLAPETRALLDALARRVAAARSRLAQAPE